MVWSFAAPRAAGKDAASSSGDARRQADRSLLDKFSNFRAWRETPVSVVEILPSCAIRSLIDWRSYLRVQEATISHSFEPPSTKNYRMEAGALASREGALFLYRPSAIVEAPSTESSKTGAPYVPFPTGSAEGARRALEPAASDVGARPGLEGDPRGP